LTLIAGALLAAWAFARDKLPSQLGQHGDMTWPSFPPEHQASSQCDPAQSSRR
jgi:hypothetical protein